MELLKRLFVLFLTLALLLSGCAFGDQEPGAATENPLAFPVGTNPYGVIDLLQEWPVRAELSEEKRREIKKAWSDHEGIDHTGHTDYFSNCVCDLVWCGSWKGYEILVDLDSTVDMIRLETPNYSNGKTSVDTVVITNQCYFYQNGAFHLVKDIHAAGMLSEQETWALCALSYSARNAYRHEIMNTMETMEQEAIAVTQDDNLDIPEGNFYGVYNGYLIYYDYGSMGEIPTFNTPGKGFMARHIRDGIEKT